MQDPMLNQDPLPENENDSPSQEATPVSEPAEQEELSLTPEPVSQEPSPAYSEPVPEHILPPQKYKLKIALLFSDFLVILGAIYVAMFVGIIRDMSNESFSLVSNRMFAFYAVLVITIALTVVVLVFKVTRSARTRFIRDNEVRQDSNIKVWLCGYDWGWPVLFVPTVALMVVVGLLGVIIDRFPGDAQAVHDILGGLVILFAALNAAVVIFKIRPVVLGLLAVGFFVSLVIMLLHGPDTLMGFFRGFRYLGVQIAPKGFLLLAYIWSIFLRIIWVRSLFFYWVFLPNRLELQHGLSESNDAVDREELRMQIDTDDVILRWWNVGIITFYFPQLDRLPITNVVIGIRKKAEFANRIASVKTMQDLFRAATVMERAEPRMDANKHELFSDRINGIDRMNKLILALLVLSGIGFIASLFVHVATYLELNLAVSTPSIRFLHIGLFAVFGLVYLYNKKYSAIENEYWKKALENAPKGLISLFSVILIWAIVHVSIGVYGFVRNGKISEVNGQKVLSKRGQIVRNLTEGE
ncbi:MAG: hypothetical protein ACYSOP_00340, partial [Planctomycetota bacterium]